MKENQKSAFKKTEELLRNYNNLKVPVENGFDNTEKTRKLLKIIRLALQSICHDDYYEVIPMIFFEQRTREEVAEEFGCDVKTITRNKNRLVNQLKLIIFSDKTIEELFLE